MPRPALCIATMHSQAPHLVTTRGSTVAQAGQYLTFAPFLILFIHFAASDNTYF